MRNLPEIVQQAAWHRFIRDDLASNRGRIILLLLCLAGPVCSTFMQYSFIFCNRLSYVVPNNAVKFRDPGLNPSLEIRPKVVADYIFHFFRHSFRLEVASDVISGKTIQEVGADVQICGQLTL